MSDIREHVAYLSQTIGPRPAGTEEEQQAALYITEKLQQEAGLPAVIEDFNCNPDYDLPRALCCGVSAIIAVVAMFIPVMTIPALIVTLLCAVVFALESFGKPIVSRLLNRGVSQNVVAKYEPKGASGTRRRKIVLVAHYDSGKVNKESTGLLFKVLTQVRWAALGGMIAVPVLFLVRTLISFGGIGLIVMNVLTGIALVCALIPLIVMALHRGAAYNESANCNAAGVAVLMNVAERVSRSADLAPEGQPEENAVMHGERAAVEAGLVPETGEFVYEAAGTDYEEVEESPAARLAAAKAAIAALTGQPVSTTINIDFDEEPAYEPLVESPAIFEGEAFAGEGAYADGLADSTMSFVEGIAADVAAGAAAAAAVEAAELVGEAKLAEAAATAAEAADEEASSVPAWFKSAQAKAKRPAEETPIQRSRYAEAFDAFERESESRAEEQAAVALSETELRLQQMRENIMAATASSTARAAEKAAAAAPVEPAPEPAAPVSEPASEPVSQPEVAPAVTPQPAQPQVPAAAAVPAPEPAKPAKPAAAAADLGATTAFTPVPVDPAALAAEAAALEPAAPVRKQPTPRPRRAISLPSIGGIGETAPAAESAAAPAAPVSRTGRVRGLRSVLPSIGGSDPIEPTPAPEEPVADPFAPKPVEAYQEEAEAPIPPEEQPADSYEEDYAEPAYEEDYYEEEEAFASPYMEMPKSRRERFFDKFRFGRKKKEEATVQSTPQEWLDVDDEFDARTAGKARGSWESFRQEDPVEEAYSDNDAYGYDDGYGYDGYADSYSDGYGGGYAANDDAYAYEDEAYELGATTQFQPVDSWGEDDYEEPAPRRGARRAGKRRWQGGSFSGEQLDRIEGVFGDDESYEAYVDAMYDDAAQQLEAFHADAINTEVWFVALGSELAANGGMNAFVTAHAKDLKGAIIIELDALGAGELTLIEKEGLYKPRTVSSRMKRYARKAAAELGMSVGSGSILWKDGPAAFAMKKGFQAMHIAGMADGKPALFGQANDMLENISDEALQMNSDYVMELIKQI